MAYGCNAFNAADIWAKLNDLSLLYAFQNVSKRQIFHFQTQTQTQTRTLCGAVRAIVSFLVCEKLTSTVYGNEQNLYKLNVTAPG